MGLSRKKRNIVTSRLKAFYTFSDTFQSALKSGWKVIRSGWAAGSSQASASSLSSYPLLATTMASPNVTIDIKNPGIGIGAALWVTSAGEWYGLVTQQQLSSGTGNCSSSNPYNPCGYTNPVVSCCYQTVVPAYTNQPYSYYVPVNNCPSVNSPVNSYQNSVTPGTINPYSCAYNPCGSSNPYVCNPTYYVCYGYAPYNSYLCGFFGTSCGQCTTEYGPYGGNCSGGNCRGTFTCGGGNTNPPSGGNYNPYIPGSCNPPTGGPVFVPSTTNSAYNQCQNCGGGCVATGGSCNTYNDTFPRYLKLVKFASNVLTEIASVVVDQVTSFAVPKGLKVIISNSNPAAQTATVTAKLYSDEAMVTQIGSSMIHNATGVKINTSYGILASPSSYNQGDSVTSVAIG
jgi:hypothetical protein